MNKGKKILTITIIAFLIGSFFGIAMAADDFTNDGNDRKGKYIYRQNCRTCHDGSSGPTLSPNSKTQAQWEAVFKNNDQLQCTAEWQKLSEKDLGDVHAYLWGHAYDSPSPAKCK